MKSQDVAFLKEAINDEMDSIMGNNTWVLADLPPGCKPFCCKWIFKRKLKVDGTIEKFKARLVIRGFKEKLVIDYFDTYALVARMSTIILLIAMASIHNLIIHQMDVKTAFLNGDLNEEVDLTKEFLSSMFPMKDMGEVDVILGIRIKHESNGIVISQSHYIEKVLKKFYYFDCTLVSTPMDTSEKLMPNNGQVVSQLEYSRVIGCLMYAMTCTKPDIAFSLGKLSRYTSNPAGSAKLRIIRLQLARYSCLMVVQFLGLPRNKLASLVQQWNLNMCDCAATLAKAYSQMYNEKSRHLGVRHSMIRELITNGMISIEFVRSQQNLADHLMKGLARDLVIKSAEGMRLKSN
ncbi:zinc finger, CCHC-type containing protein [Tanacetum coccineum]